MHFNVTRYVYPLMQHCRWGDMAIVDTKSFILSAALYSWSVIWGDDTQIKLKFSSRVPRRVKESTWHPSQSIVGLPDGDCEMSLQVGSALEITPWIRSWRPDVEVLEPDSLKQEFRGWAQQLYKIYGPGNQ